MPSKEEEIKEGVLTLEILNKAVDVIKQCELDNKVIGFKVHPADLGEIRNGTMAYCGIVDNSLLMIPPYQGLRLEPDINQPRGYVETIRSK